MKTKRHINKDKWYCLTGIESGMYKTKCEVKIAVNEQETMFHVVGRNFRINQCVIFGVSFLCQHNAAMEFFKSKIRLNMGMVFFSVKLQYNK